MLLRFQIGDGYDASMPVHLSVDASGTMTTYARCVCGYGGVAAWLCCCVCVWLCGCVGGSGSDCGLGCCCRHHLGTAQLTVGDFEPGFERRWVALSDGGELCISGRVNDFKKRKAEEEAAAAAAAAALAEEAAAEAAAEAQRVVRCRVVLQASACASTARHRATVADQRSACVPIHRPPSVDVWSWKHGSRPRHRRSWKRFAWSWLVLVRPRRRGSVRGPGTTTTAVFTPHRVTSWRTAHHGACAVFVCPAAEEARRAAAAEQAAARVSELEALRAAEVERMRKEQEAAAAAAAAAAADAVRLQRELEEAQRVASQATAYAGADQVQESTFDVTGEGLIPDVMEQLDGHELCVHVAQPPAFGCGGCNHLTCNHSHLFLCVMMLLPPFGSYIRSHSGHYLAGNETGAVGFTTADSRDMNRELVRFVFNVKLNCVALMFPVFNAFVGSSSAWDVHTGPAVTALEHWEVVLLDAATLKVALRSAPLGWHLRANPAGRWGVTDFKYVSWTAQHSWVAFRVTRVVRCAFLPRPNECVFTLEPASVSNPPTCWSRRCRNGCVTPRGYVMRRRAALR